MSPSEQTLRRVFPDLCKHLPLQSYLLTFPRRRFAEGDVLLEDGAFVRYLPLVLEGLVKVYKEDEQANEVLLYYISQGESCIMSAFYCLHQERSNIKAIVEQSAEIILVPAKS
ncbi:MAG: hypothetical protein D6772_14925, partial [Bacteroidetes bacterium]